MVQLMQGEDDPLKISNQLKIFVLCVKSNEHLNLREVR